MAPTIKIAVVMPLGAQRGGGELMLTQAVTFSDRSLIEWLVIFLEQGPMIEEYRALGVSTVLVPAGRLRQPIRYLQTIWRIARLARREKVSGIVGWMSKAHYYGSPASWLAGIPSFWYQLGVHNPASRMDRWAARLPARGIVTLSKAGFEAQRLASPKVPSRLVYPGADLRRFDSQTLPTVQETRRKLGLPLDAAVVGIAGRLQRWKGMHTLIAAMPKLLEKFPELTCVIVGGGHALEPEYPAQLSSLARDLGVENRLRMVGLQTNVHEWLHAMDVVVHASDNEPFGIVVIEAMALGKPLVAGEKGGPAEIITAGVDGLLAPFENPAALSDCILRFLTDSEYAKNVGGSARVRARQFSVEAYASNLTAAFQELLRMSPEESAA
jgi:glycosyltransferase involved in cell wall biosynthesis